MGLGQSSNVRYSTLRAGIGGGRGFSFSGEMSKKSVALRIYKETDFFKDVV